VKLSTDGGSLSIGNDMGEVHKAKSMILLWKPEKSQWLDQCRQLSSGKRKSISHVTVAVAPVIVCRINVEGRKDATRSDDGPIYKQKQKPGY
jgi:urease accessory protein UreH